MLQILQYVFFKVINSSFFLFVERGFIRNPIRTWPELTVLRISVSRRITSRADISKNKYSFTSEQVFGLLSLTAPFGFPSKVVTAVLTHFSQSKPIEHMSIQNLYRTFNTLVFMGIIEFGSKR